MRKYFAIIIAALVLVAIFSPTVQDAILMFLAAGIIPGTSYSVPPQVIIALAAIALVPVLLLGHRETRKISLPPIEPTKKPKRKPQKRAKKA